MLTNIKKNNKRNKPKSPISYYESVNHLTIIRSLSAWNISFKKFIQFSIITMLITTTIGPVAIGYSNYDKESNSSNTSFYTTSISLPQGGWCEKSGNITILHLNGSYYNMGYQHGFLMKEKIQQFYRAFLSVYEQYDYSYGMLLEIWNESYEYIPDCYIEEMEGISDGSNIPFEDIAVLNTMPLIFNTIGMECCAAAAWGSATKDGKLYHMRSADYILTVKDPESETCLQDTAILVVRTPEEGYASVTPEFPGWACTWNGINEQEIAISEMTCLTTDYSFEGISAAFRIRMVLDSASTAEEAIEILNSNRTCGWNFIISDGKVPMSHILEQTASKSYVGSWNDTLESTRPFWEIDHVCRRANFFLDPECAKTQRNYYNPRFHVLFSFLNPRKTDNVVWSIVWLHYKSLSKGIMKNMGKLDLEKTMEVTKNIYDLKYDFMWWFMANIWYKNDPITNLWQWVACPETGDILLSFAQGGTSAHHVPSQLFNMYDLFSAVPP